MGRIRLMRLVCSISLIRPISPIPHKPEAYATTKQGDFSVKSGARFVFRSCSPQDLFASLARINYHVLRDARCLSWR
ncbi:MAG: hypothetical protein JWM11_2107 [Planctomycetaceae bacterium]|nr:hypothetical protein [Planctomycetaceae bacterium]